MSLMSSGQARKFCYGKQRSVAILSKVQIKVVVMHTFPFFSLKNRSVWSSWYRQVYLNRVIRKDAD